MLHPDRRGRRVFERQLDGGFVTCGLTMAAGTKTYSSICGPSTGVTPVTGGATYEVGIVPWGSLDARFPTATIESDEKTLALQALANL